MPASRSSKVLKPKCKYQRKSQDKNGDAGRGYRLQLVGRRPGRNDVSVHSSVRLVENTDVGSTVRRRVPGLRPPLLRPKPTDDECVALFEAMLALRDMFHSSCDYNVTNEDLGRRCRIDLYESMPCVVFNCAGMLFNGTDTPDCGHGGPMPGGYETFHGTKDLAGILSTNGVLSRAKRTAGGKIGWYSSQKFPTALWYSHELQFGRAKFRPILKIRAKCILRIKSWFYTPADCKRYEIKEVILVPSAHGTDRWGVPHGVHGGKGRRVW